LTPQIFPRTLARNRLMEIQLEDLEYQRRAIAAVVGVLQGQVRNSFDNSNLFGIQANIPMLRRSKTLGRSQAAIVRDLIEEHLGQKGRPSLYERAKDLCGSVRGPKDLSTRPLTGR
jgi:hypothetical protein